MSHRQDAAYGHQAVTIDATREGIVRWKISTPGVGAPRCIVLLLGPQDLVALGRRSLAAIKAAQAAPGQADH